MSRNILLTFGGRAYDATIAQTAAKYRQFGADEFWCYDDRWLMHSQFRQQNAWAWDHPGHNGHRYGFGWYCWKAHVILHAMRFMKPGETICYIDADTFPVAPFGMLYDACRAEGGIFAFEATGCSNRQWVKRDVWEAVLPGVAIAHFGPEPQGHGLQMPEINLDAMLDSQHATARFMLFQKSDAPRPADFLLEWNKLLTTPGLTTRDPSARPEFPGFEENRGDQSIFSLLCLKYGLPLHREADGFGECSNKDRELYGQLFVQKYCAGDRNDLSGSRYRSGPE